MKTLLAAGALGVALAVGSPSATAVEPTFDVGKAKYRGDLAYIDVSASQPQVAPQTTVTVKPKSKGRSLNVKITGVFGPSFPGSTSQFPFAVQMKVGTTRFTGSAVGTDGTFSATGKVKARKTKGSVSITTAPFDGIFCFGDFSFKFAGRVLTFSGFARASTGSFTFDFGTLTFRGTANGK